MLWHFHRIATEVFFSLLLLCSPIGSYGQWILRGTVIDASDKLPLPGCHMLLFPDEEGYNNAKENVRPLATTITSDEGYFSFPKLNKGNYLIEARFIGYKKRLYKVALTQDRKLDLTLRPDAILLGDVVVTAKERRTKASGTLITSEAMSHIQASSLADIRVFMPGGRSSDPAMGQVNLLTIRQAGRGETDHKTSTLGTSFMVDGIPKNVNADMQQLPSLADRALRGKISAGKGIDMRTISPDDIDHIEVVRGLPSVAYGNLTNGLVKVERKRGATPLNVRIKTDQYGHLGFVGKGWDFQQQEQYAKEKRSHKQQFNIGADYYIAKVDPRNTLENYHRLTLSARYHESIPLSEEGHLQWGVSLNGGSNLDVSKSDPDNDTKGIDKYTSRKSELASAQEITYRPGNAFPFLESVEWTSNISAGFDRLEQHKLVQLDRGKPMPLSDIEGEYDGFYLPYRYEASMQVDGKPVTAYSKLAANMVASTFGMGHTLLLGGDFTFSKNYGRGNVFDPTRPVYPDLGIRARAFSDIPASSIWAFFAQDRISASLWGNSLVADLGVRGMTQMLPQGYAMQGKVYWDPRLSLEWRAPSLQFGKYALEGGLTYSWGKCSMMPLIAELFPERIYHDFIELNYYHNEQACRRLHMRSYGETPDVSDLTPAINLKQELRLDLAYRGYSISVSFFDERMRNGFRSSSHYTPYYFKLYDYEGIDSKQLAQEQRPPQLDEMPYKEINRFASTNRTTNGSALEKRGLEWQFFTPRISAIATRFTFSGAYYTSRFTNSEAQYLLPSISHYMGQEISLVGRFASVEDSRHRMLSTNLTFDTYIKSIDLIASFSIQSLWLSERRLFPPSQHILQGKEGQMLVLPMAYVTADGVEHPFTEQDISTGETRFLVRNFDDGLTKPTRTGHSTNIDIKITKKIGKRVSSALFINRIFDVNPPYQSRGLTVRSFSSSYFGLEFNFKF